MTTVTLPLASRSTRTLSFGPKLIFYQKPTRRRRFHPHAGGKSVAPAELSRHFQKTGIIPTQNHIDFKRIYGRVWGMASAASLRRLTSTVSIPTRPAMASSKRSRTKVPS